MKGFTVRPRTIFDVIDLDKEEQAPELDAAVSSHRDEAEATSVAAEFAKQRADAIAEPNQ